MRTTIDLNLLNALDALLDERSVTRAGRRIGLSQPAMSDALGRLRRHFGDELLVRVGNRYELTPLGASLRASSAAAVELVDQTFRIAESFDPATCEREFTLLASDYAAGVLGSHLIAAVRGQAPGARLRFGRIPAEEPETTITPHARNVDGFVLPRGIAVEGFPGVTLFRDRWVCALSDDNPAALQPLTVEVLASLPWVLHELAERATSIMGTLRAHGLRPEVEVVVDQFSLVADLVRESKRACVVQERLLAGKATSAGLQLLPLPFDVAPVVETFWWHPVHTRDPAHRWLRDQVVAAGRLIERG
ncbi:LysR family transcriptional regulator [Lentzea pudingi]|uniref:LysR family transcriptional regulator n=1 Tax=Lentzea pudingi TaxID=1789439 RepID=A0ABQ2HYT5_9PSEU|nr:LysR family transcriptional regulator [Lentzea pudingi]GGM94762.1 LysR family transcriptional regulator [Lentzea pudingi]